MRTTAILVVTCLCGPPLAYGQAIAAWRRRGSGTEVSLASRGRQLAVPRGPQPAGGVLGRREYIPLREGRDDWFLSFGGEARGTWEWIDNDNWGQQPFSNSFVNQRYMFHVDARYGEHFRSFVELKSGVNAGRTGGPRPIDEKKLDVQAAFFEAGAGNDRTSIKVRVGRHEMEYGSGRLIDVREGPNVRLSFDGVKVKSGIGSWQIDGFAMRPVKDEPGFFDNSPNHSVGFWGVYGVRPLTRHVTLDTY